MVKINKIAYWLLLFALLLSACGVASLGTARANYKNNVFWNTVVKSGQPVSSDCLVPNGQIILLGEVTEETEIAINFRAQSDIFGILDCELVDPEQSVYLAAFLTNNEISLKRGVQSVGLHLMPTEEASKLETPINVDVYVSFVAGEQVLQGTFRVVLPGAVKKDPVYNIENDTGIIGGNGTKDPVYDIENDTGIIGGNGTKDPVYDIENDTGIIGGNGTKDPVYDIENDAGIIGGNGTKDPVYDIENDAGIIGGNGIKDPVYDIEDDTIVFSLAAIEDETQTRDPVYDIQNDTGIIGGGNGNDDISGADDPVYDIEDDTGIIGGVAGGDDTVGTKDPVYDIENDTGIIGGNGASGIKDPVYDIGKDTEILEIEDMLVESLTVYSKMNMLPVSIETPEGIARLKVMLLEPEQGGETWLPAFSRYSPDGGESWYMLYYGGAIVIEEDDLYAFQSTGKMLVLDFSGTDTSLGEVLYVQATAYDEKAQYIGVAEVYSMDAFMTMSSYDLNEAPILTADQPLALAEYGADGARSYTLEKLTRQENGMTQYKYLNDDSIFVQFQNGVALLETGDALPEAGTYRLTVEYTYKGLCFAVSQHTFFVNYSGHTHAVNWG